jgi:hypothetical protein
MFKVSNLTHDGFLRIICRLFRLLASSDMSSLDRYPLICRYLTHIHRHVRFSCTLHKNKT